MNRKFEYSNSKESIKKYESALKEYFNAKYCLAVSSGTAAITVALHACSIGSGDKIALSPVAPLCTAFPIIYSGAEIKFFDIQTESLALDYNLIENNVADAIIEVPMWGYPIDAIKSREFATKREIPLIFDLAHCAGTTFNDKPISNYCDIACFSTQKNKMFSTGEGGFLLTDNEELYNRAKLFSTMGELDGVNFGVNFKLSPFLAEIGIANLKQLNNSIQRRITNRSFIISNINNNNIVEHANTINGQPSYQRLLFRTKNFKPGLSEWLDKHELQTDKSKYNIRALYLYPVLKEYKADCPNAESFISSFATVNVHEEMTESQLNKIVYAINSFIDE